MTWPTVTIVTTDMDAAGDAPGNARAQIKQMADNVNAIKDAKGAALGIAELDAGALVPVAQMPIVTAVKGGTGQSSFVVGDIFYANSTTTLAKLTAAAAGKVLTANGAGVAPSYQDSGAGFASGTRMLFQQTAAPTGWTKETGGTYNDTALRIVTGSVSGGGATAFSTVFSGNTGSHIVTPVEIPIYSTATGGSFGGITGFVAGSAVKHPSAWQGHDHPMPNLKYFDCIIAQKD